MKTIAVCNLKGGVAKTTTAVNLAADLARYHDKRVLLIDADSQANATSFLGGSQDAVGMAAILRHELTDEKPLELQRTNVAGVELVSGSADLMDLDLTKAGEELVDVQCLCKLRSYLEVRETVRRTYQPGLFGMLFGEPFDYCLIDCPPAFNAASAAALLAADEVLIPVKIDAFALEGMANLMQQIANMRKINPRLRVAGLLPVMWYKSAEISKAEMALRDSGLTVLPRIRRSNRVDDMTFAQQPLCVCSPKSGAAQDYRRLAQRIAAEKGGESNGV